MVRSCYVQIRNFVLIAALISLAGILALVLQMNNARMERVTGDEARQRIEQTTGLILPRSAVNIEYRAQSLLNSSYATAYFSLAPEAYAEFIIPAGAVIETGCWKLVELPQGIQLHSPDCRGASRLMMIDKTNPALWRITLMLT